MSLDVAFSLELNDFVDPDRAYDLYWAGLISDKRAFVCPGTGCTAQVTCANIDRDIQDMKVVPHFKAYGKCSETCEIFREKPQKHLFGDKASSREKATIDQSVADEFLLERPAGYYDKPVPSSEALTNISQTLHNKKQAEKRFRESGTIGRIYSVRSVVSRYIRYKKASELKLRRVNVRGRDIRYDQIFKPVEDIDVTELPDENRIYYGWAFVNRLQSDTGYQIKFFKRMHDGDEEVTVTVRIFDDAIEQYEIRKLMRSRLESIAKLESPRAFIFFYARPEVRESKGRLYADSIIRNLDMIDVNKQSPGPKIFM